MRSERQDTHRTEYLCRFCGLRVVDGSEEAGAPPESQPAWMTPDGDFGCDPSPETSEDGVGGHAVTAEEEERARAWAAEHNAPDDFEEWARRDLEAKGLSPEKAREVVRNTYGPDTEYKVWVHVEVIEDGVSYHEAQEPELAGTYPTLTVANNVAASLVDAAASINEAREEEAQP